MNVGRRTPIFSQKKGLRLSLSRILKSSDYVNNKCRILATISSFGTRTTFMILIFYSTALHPRPRHNLTAFSHRQKYVECLRKIVWCRRNCFLRCCCFSWRSYGFCKNDQYRLCTECMQTFRADFFTANCLYISKVVKCSWYMKTLQIDSI